MKARTLVAAVLVLLGGLVVTTLTWQVSDQSPPVTTTKNIEVGASAAQARPEAGQPVALPGSAPVGIQTANAASMSARVKVLSASSDPRDAFTAFHILSQCKWAREEQQQHQMKRLSEQDAGRAVLVEAGVVGEKAIERACGDLREGDFVGRLALVERAAEAGVPMAALRLANEGPWGDMQAAYTRWDDPLVQEWRARMIRLWTLAAKNGDVSTLNALQAQYETGAGLVAERNPELALQFAVAKHLVHEAQTGRKIVGAKGELAALAAVVSPDAALRARAAGESLAKEALGGKK